ncbi:squalene synthetase-like protein [Coemansia guatemalensis]|uniref:Squalene synthetase-like protein n=1 Tax=Coemansia guatemalensis TaxID=2761395 RepID=A0A9W8HZ11_9FUNG|nr:squalene synthetase-like protein [Coemansia guatemalensis]
MDDLFVIDTKGSKDTTASTSWRAREFRVVGAGVEQTTQTTQNSQKVRVIEDDVPQGRSTADHGSAPTSRGTAAIRNLNAQFVDLEVDEPGKGKGKKRNKRRGKKRGKEKAAADSTHPQNRSKQQPGLISDEDFDDLANDYMANLSDGELQRIIATDFSPAFNSRDIGGAADIRYGMDLDMLVDSEAVSSDDLEVEDPFIYKDKEVYQVMDESDELDGDDLDDDGFPYDIDMHSVPGADDYSFPGDRGDNAVQNTRTPKGWGGHGKDKHSRRQQQKKKKGKAANNYDDAGPSPGFNPHTVLKRMDLLTHAGDLDSIWLQPMNKYERQIVHLFAREYKIKSKSQGTGLRRMPVLTATPNTRKPQNRKRINKILTLFDEGGLMPGQWLGASGADNHTRERSGPGKKGNWRDRGGNEHGTIVAEHAPEVGASNVGHRMLQQMGWTPGQGLGAGEKGRATPVDVMIRAGRRGLGA